VIRHRILSNTLTAILLCTALPRLTFGQQAELNVTLNGVPLSSALTRIQDASGLRLAFASDLVRDAEPVTLSAKDEPVDSVLRRILRPRGMEFIYTADTMAAIVPQASEAGMAKAAGRALRTFARLARKMETARQEGDEIVMPEWEEKDDWALAEAYVELDCVQDYFARRLQNDSISKEEMDEMRRALECHDPEVRIGLTTTYCSYYRMDEQPLEHPERVGESIAKMAADPDPLVRAAAVIVKAGWNTYRTWCPDSAQVAADGDADALVPGRPEVSAYVSGRGKEGELRAWAADAASEVRFAAAICFSGYQYYRFADEILDVLHADQCAAVRAAAWPRPWPVSPQRPDLDPGLREEQLAALGRGLRDPNPTVRTIVVGRMAGMLLDDADKTSAVLGCDQLAPQFDDLLKVDREKLRAVLKAEAVEDDPWTALAAEAFMAGRALVWHTRLMWKSRVTGREWVTPEAVEERNMAAGLIAIRLLGSGKRSHELLGCAALMEWLSVLATARPQKDSAITLDPVAAHADSPHLLTRLVAIAACGALAPANADAEARLLKALSSDDRLDRLAGLWGCCVMETGGGSPALQQAVSRLLRSRDAVECSLAARAAARVLPIQRAIEVLQDQCRSLPESYATAAMIEWMARTRPSAVCDPGDQVQNQMMLLDAVLESKNAALQSRFVRCAGNRDSFKNNDPLNLACITETEPDALCEYLRRARPAKLFTVDPVLQRMEGLMRTADGKPSIRAVGTIVWWAMGNKEIMAANSDRIYAMIPPLETCFRPGASDEEIGKAGAAVSHLITSVVPVRRFDPGAPGKWSDVPPAMIAACRAYFGQANHPVYHGWVAFTLAECYERITNEPDNQIDTGLFDAMEAARAAIMERGSSRDQAMVLNAVARCADDSLAGPAMDELQRRFVAGALPVEPRNRAGSADLFCYVLDQWLARNKKPLSAEVVKCLIDRINAPSEDTYQPVLSRVINVVASQPGTVEPLIAALQQLAQKEPESLEWAPRAIDLFRQELEKVRQAGKPDPPWLHAAIELAPKIAAYVRSTQLAEDAMRFYREAAGPGADAKIEAMVQDEKLAANVRAAAAAEVLRTNPDTKLLVTFAEEYSRLPVNTRTLLASAALSPKKLPEGAIAFFKRYYVDRQVDAHRRTWAMNHEHAPLSPELRPIFEELANDPDVGQAANQAIQHLDAAAARHDGASKEKAK